MLLLLRQTQYLLAQNHEQKGNGSDRMFSGVVCGVFGTEIRTGKGKGTTGGKFLVEEIVFPEEPAQMKLEPMKENRCRCGYIS